jgi:hypothetical protein
MTLSGGYFLGIRRRSVRERRRFVIVSTAVSFTAIVVIWAILIVVSRDAPVAAPSPEAAVPDEQVAGSAASPRVPSPETSVAATPSSDPVGGLPALLGSPVPSPARLPTL